MVLLLLLRLGLPLGQRLVNAGSTEYRPRVFVCVVVGGVAVRTEQSAPSVLSGVHCASVCPAR